MITTKVEPIDRDVQLILSEVLSPEARSAMFAETAQAFLNDADDTNRQILGRLPPSKTYVDGFEGAALTAVKPDGGIIVREYDLVVDLLVWIGQQLELHSPIGGARDKHPGLYQHSHTLFADGVEVKLGEQIPAATEYAFLNLQPYARKIEGGSKPPSSSQAPEGVYNAVADLARRQFTNVAKITFAFRAPLSGAVADWAQTPSARAHAAAHSHRRDALHTEWLTRQPAIIVRLS